MMRIVLLKQWNPGKYDGFGCGVNEYTHSFKGETCWEKFACKTENKDGRIILKWILDIGLSVVRN
jgi:hypothetical protein